MAKVNLSLDLALWRAFRSACVTRGTSASREIARLIRDQLKAWGVTLSLGCLALVLCNGCANQGGMLGSGLYKANILTQRGLPTRKGMTPAQVVAVMGPSWDTIGGYRGEVWRYGVNLFGLIGPSCVRGGPGSDIMCINVYFVDGKVYDVVSY